MTSFVLKMYWPWLNIASEEFSKNFKPINVPQFLSLIPSFVYVLLTILVFEYTHKTFDLGDLAPMFIPPTFWPLVNHSNQIDYQSKATSLSELLKSKISFYNITKAIGYLRGRVNGFEEWKLHNVSAIYLHRKSLSIIIKNFFSNSSSDNIIII